MTRPIGRRRFLCARHTSTTASLTPSQGFLSE